MAEERKRKREEFEYSGYIQHVSPIKMSRRDNQWFDGIIQYGKNDFKKVVCFKSTARKNFLEAQEKKSPVKLAACTVGPNNDNKQVMDLLFGSSSRMSYLDCVPFKQRAYVAEVKKEKEAVDCLISQILIWKSEEKVNLKAKVMFDLSPEEDVYAFGEWKKVRKIMVGDPSGFIELSLWNQFMKSTIEGHSYKFTNLAVKEWKNCKRLATSVHTHITEEEETICCDVSLMKHVEDVIDSVKVSILVTCPMCGTVIEETVAGKTTIRCPRDSCSKRMRCSSLASVMKCEFTIVVKNGTTFHFEMGGSLFKKFITDIGSSMDDNADSIEERMLCCGEVKVIHQEQKVIDISVVTSD